VDFGWLRYIPRNSTSQVLVTDAGHLWKNTVITVWNEEGREQIILQKLHLIVTLQKLHLIVTDRQTEIAWAHLVRGQRHNMLLVTSINVNNTTESHREVIFHLFAGNSPLSQIQLKLASERGPRHNQPYQVWWRSDQRVHSYGLLHRNGLSPITL